MENIKFLRGGLMKCNHCDNEAVYSEDFAVWAKISNKNMGKSIAGTIIGGVLGGALGAIAVGSAVDDNTYNQYFMGFIRENSCENCLRVELDKAIIKCKRSILLNILPIIAGVFGVVFFILKLIADEGSDNEINAFIWLTGGCVCVTIFAVFFLVCNISELHKYEKMRTESNIESGAVPNNYKIAFKAPLYNVRQVDDNNKNKINFKDKNCHNEFSDMLLKKHSAVVSPMKEVMEMTQFESDTSITVIKELYEQLTDRLTDEKEEARVELLQSRLK
ncbi:MAG: hypothetical protein LBL87_05140 [Ruminococcus sp.]|jgi:hypothetical protein|nr:hypothetical protein [Ruminococcus sp.]